MMSRCDKKQKDLLLHIFFELDLSNIIKDIDRYARFELISPSDASHLALGHIDLEEGSTNEKRGSFTSRL